MAATGNKRRKVEHNSSNEGDDDASFASFDSTENESNLEDRSDDDEKQDSDGESLEENGADSSDNEIEETQRTRSAPARDQAVEQPSAKIVSPPHGAAYKNAGSRSSILSVQIDELLSQIRPKHGKKEMAAEEALHKIKSTIESIPATNPVSIKEAERNFAAENKSKVAIPFPDPRPSQDAKYKLECARPSNINVVGSYALGTYSRANRAIEIDMTVTMPSTMFQEKDFLDYRYFHKRAYYLACIAAGLREAHQDFEIRFHSLHGDTLKPIVVVSPILENATGSITERAPKWQINIIPCIPPDTFAYEKLRPDKSCVRTTAHANGHGANRQAHPTPFYNSSLRADMSMSSYLKALHQASKKCEQWKDASLLGRAWLHQRGFSSIVHNGGFGNFEFSALMALLLDGGERSLLGERWKSYQLFKGTLQFLATRDASSSSLALDIGEVTVKPSVVSEQNGAPVVWDSHRMHSLFYKMTPWSYKQLRHEARTTLNMLGDYRLDNAFEATFAFKADQLLLKYDFILQSSASAFASPDSRQRFSHALTDYQKLHSIFQRGLGDRISLLAILPPLPGSWELDSLGARESLQKPLRIGFIVNPATVNRTVDHGPPAEDKAGTASFREFWGKKAELRRFKDGSILESLVWNTSTAKSVFEQIVRYLIARAFGQEAEQDTTIIGTGLERLLSQTSKSDAFQPLMEAYAQLETDIRVLENLPLSVRQILPCDAQLRYASIISPGSSKQSIPSDVTIQFEGSTRWPDDVAAVQRTKIAFLLNIAEKLEESVDGAVAKMCLENEEHDIFNQAFLDVVYDSGMAFRLRIHHELEQVLLERKLKDKTLDPRSKELSAQALAHYKRDYVRGPAFTQAIARLCSRYPALSGTIRLTKKWFASHLLSNHVANEVIEMLVARTFVQPWPWQTPSSVQTGFLRTLSWISRWNWWNEPLIVDLSGSGELKQADVQSIKTKFGAWRSLDPALNRVVLFCGSNVDPAGTSWTDGRTPKVVAARMTSLAKAACIEVERKGVLVEPAALFSSGLTDFDFVLHLRANASGHKTRRKHASTNGTTFKNLEIDAQGDPTAVGYKAIDNFRTELEDMYGSSILFFSGGDEGPIIAALWNPQTSSRAWKLNLAYSTIPQLSSEKDDVQAVLNKEAILSEIARLGGDIVEKIEVNKL